MHEGNLTEKMMRCQLFSRVYQGPILMSVFLLPPYPVAYALKTGSNVFQPSSIIQHPILY